MSSTASSKRPLWALPALLVGIACSLVVAWISAEYGAYVGEGGAPSISFAYGLQQVPFLLFGVPLLLAGADAAVRPWRGGRPWLRWVVAGAVIAWILFVLGVPMLVAEAWA